MNKLNIYKLQTGKAPTIDVPASKSISNRLLILNALYGNRIQIQNLSESEDTRLLKLLLEQFSQNKTNVPFDCQNAGTVFRFLTAFLSFQPASFSLTGNSAMKKRPVFPLVDAIKKIDSNIEITYLEKPGYPPLKIHGKKLPGEINTKIDSSISSQFITALLLAGIPTGITLEIDNQPASYSYIQMTLSLLEQLRIHYQLCQNTITIPAQSVQKQDIFVEYDWSSAAPWYVLTSTMPKGFSMQIFGLQQNSIQGDQYLSKLFKHMGVQTKFYQSYIKLRKISYPDIQELTFDTTEIPDTVPYLLTACAANKINLKLTGISQLRYKESDRIEAMKQELDKTGSKLELCSPDSLKLHSPGSFNKIKDLTVHSHGDHRIAMAFAPLASLIENIAITGYDTVSKSYPTFWNEFQKCGFQTQ